jgi:hypothetical protein
MRHKIGDKIRIKDSIGTDPFNEKINRLKTDRVVTIINIVTCIYAQHESSYMVKELTYHFTEDMVEEIKIEPIEDRFEILDL